MSHFSGDASKVWPCVLGGVAIGTLVSLVLAHSTKPACCNKRPGKPTLVYFDGRGLAEVARQMLAVAGVEYTDKRYPLTVVDGDGPVYGRIRKPEMDADAKAGKFMENMDRLPLMEVDGKRFGGSKAIYRYIANTYGLNGSSSLDAASIDGICEAVYDISEAFGKATDKNKWFDVPSSVGFKQGERQLQWYMEKLDKLVGSDGFAVGGRVSMADAIIYNKFGENATTKGLFGNTKSEPMDDKARLHATMAKCSPNLLKIVKSFESQPGVQQHLATRGTQWF